MINHLKVFIKKNFSSFAFFYNYLRHKIFVAVILSIIITILDGFGLSMFLPLLQTVGGSNSVNATSLGNLGFITTFIEGLGIKMNIVSILVFMVLFFIGKGIASYASMVYIILLQQSFIKAIRLQLLDSLNAISFKKFVTSDAGRIQNAMSGEVDRVAQSYTNYFRSFQQGVMVVVYMGFAFFVDVQFAILVSVGGALTNIMYKYIYTNTKGASRKLTSSSNTYQGEIIQHVGNFKYLKATGLVNTYGDKLKQTIHKIENSRKKIGILGSIGAATREPLLVIVVASVIFIQTTLLNGQMGPILVSLLFFYRALTALIAMQQSWNSFLSVSGSLENIQDFQKELRNGKEKTGELHFTTLTKSIVINKVYFSYGSTSILKNINLEIKRNESVAFVGESGSGKSTFVSLIAGLLSEDSGTISIDGVLLRDINKISYQQKIGYITQEPVIFDDTIFNNITFWSLPSPQNVDKFMEAIRKASLTSFMSTLPDGEHTKLGNNGINLSGGQRQRIAIARELYKDIDILIMDEATSALDSETELAIQQSIDSLQGYYTVIIVAHRLSTIRNVDSIVLMNNGQIESIGSFSELMEKQPKFKKMVELQDVTNESKI